MVQLKLKLKAKIKRRDPASAGKRWRLGDDALLRIRNTSLHSEMALRRRSAYVNTQYLYENTRNSKIEFEECKLRLGVSQDRICDDVAPPHVGGINSRFRAASCLPVGTMPGALGLIPGDREIFPAQRITSRTYYLPYKISHEI